MSKENVKFMFAKLEKDPELQKKYAEIMKAYRTEPEKNIAEMLIGFGKTAGFNFSKDDLLAARAELMDKTNFNKELSDNDIGKVAGGFLPEQSGKDTVVVNHSSPYLNALGLLPERK